MVVQSTGVNKNNGLQGGSNFADIVRHIYVLMKGSAGFFSGGEKVTRLGNSREIELKTS